MLSPPINFLMIFLQMAILKREMTDQLYSEADHKFLADRYVVGACPRCGFENARGDECPRCGASYDATELKNPRSKLTNAPLTLKPTKHWFLLLDIFKERLQSWIETKNWKPNVINFIKDYIEHLHARAITRDCLGEFPFPCLMLKEKFFMSGSMHLSAIFQRQKSGRKRSISRTMEGILV